MWFSRGSSSEKWQLASLCSLVGQARLDAKTTLLREGFCGENDRRDRRALPYMAPVEHWSSTTSRRVTPRREADTRLRVVSRMA